MALKCFFLLISCIIITDAELPVHVSPTNVTDKSCSSFSSSSSLEDIQDAVRDRVNPYLNQRYGRIHNCGGPGWTEVVKINMSNENSVCPAGLVTLTSPIRSCGISGLTSTATFPVSQNYSGVCGRISGIQKGTPDSFSSSTSDPVDEYVDGFTIRNGDQYNEGHIWTFAGSLSQVPTSDRCPCATGRINVPPPSFVGSHYFCDSGNFEAAAPTSMYYLNNSLWDGEDCLPNSKCCRLNNPPWFYRELPASSAQSLKLDMQLNYRPSNEDIIITETELYVSR